jgi:hypothetical protein
MVNATLHLSSTSGMELVEMRAETIPNRPTRDAVACAHLSARSRARSSDCCSPAPRASGSSRATGRARPAAAGGAAGPGAAAGAGSAAARAPCAWQPPRLTGTSSSKAPAAARRGQSGKSSGSALPGRPEEPAAGRRPLAALSERAQRPLTAVRQGIPRSFPSEFARRVARDGSACGTGRRHH